MTVDFERILEQEHTLDPENWEEMELLGIKMVKDMLNYLKDIRQNPAWQPIGDDVKKKLNQPIPQSPESIREVYNGFVENILPFPTGNIHPRFWAWADGTGTPFAMLAEMLAAGMNPNVCAGEHSAMYVEQQVIDWLKSIMGFPQTSSGSLISGGAMSNLTALIVARNSFTNQLIRKKGLRSVQGQMVLYASTETHSCIEKAADVMGLGRDAVRKIQVSENYQLDIASLEKAIKEDRKNGLLPFCIVANAGTVNTGAIDPLKEISLICKREKLWMHIDGAFGAFAKLTNEYQEILKPIEVADSISFDLHKWMYMPFGIGCLLIKDKDLHKKSFAIEVDYLLRHERGLASGPEMIADYGIEMSRGFKSLPIWMSIQAHGINKFEQLVRQNIAQAFYLKHLIDQESDLELLAPVSLNIVCFRFNGGFEYKEQQLNAVNKKILMQLQETGRAVPSYTILNGKYAIRVAVINHRSVKEDFKLLVQAVISAGSALMKKPLHKKLATC